jgi:hypothetical protein
MSLTNQSKKKKKRPKSNNETLKFEKRAKTFDSHIDPQLLNLVVFSDREN